MAKIKKKMQHFKSIWAKQITEHRLQSDGSLSVNLAGLRLAAVRSSSSPDMVVEGVSETCLTFAISGVEEEESGLHATS